MEVTSYMQMFVWKKVKKERNCKINVVLLETYVTTSFEGK